MQCLSFRKPLTTCLSHELFGVLMSLSVMSCACAQPEEIAREKIGAYCCIRL